MKFYPSARERIEIVLLCDGDLIDANTPEVLAEYGRTDDLHGLTIPADVARWTIAPLGASETSCALRRAGNLPTDVALALRLQSETRARHLASGATEDEAADRATSEVETPEGAAAAVAEWNERYALAVVQLGLKSCSAWPDVVPPAVGGMEQYPLDLCRRIPMPARIELAKRIEGVSALCHAGKASSGSPSGGPGPKPTSGHASPAGPNAPPAATAADPFPPNC